ncbi:ATP-dependent DNA helicase RecG [Flavobacterium sp. CYK-55]|uniref:ATP-dependent DNA helicase RecG n=1 Tax=Flavobacterium sp. CYK-55 TaxID=2835529 RepID=UPI001BD10055|nr:ATP-dependent DNA helicase RecG [Flavobacterium sp. CYK-55]MBS7786224.1 ATP-dependent DNA helicase RecG [Flavobacterium sp. CYK-55]
MSELLQTPIEYLKGVGPSRGQLLRKELGIHTYADLLQFFPHRYIDRTRYYKINELREQPTEVQLVGKIIHIKTVEQKRGKRLVANFVDETGQMELVWFQGHKWIRENLPLNVPIVIFGRCQLFNHQFSMPHPEIELLSEHQQNLRGALQAMYRSTEALSNKGFTHRTFGKLVQQALLETRDLIAETLPEHLLSAWQLMPKKEAMLQVHFPRDNDGLSKAQFRLKFEELFYIQLQLISKNLIRKHKIKGHAFNQVGTYFNEFYQNHLPFDLTGAQKRVLKEIRNDMGQPAQMNRLLQGDVGSGKTIVAFMSMLLALDNGFQACLMAPTEILANQHYIGLSELADKMGISIKILTGSTKTAERKVIHEMLESGQLKILIGTHALLEDKVQFHNLGLAVIDEQHRFGVEQRSKLWKKNSIPPHVLVMTATPIPRTLAMSLYGDLDLSVIDELPPGRKPIQTVHRFDSNRLKVWKFMRDEIALGRQIYIVYPLIQESEKMDLKDLMDGYESISRDFPLPEYAISIVHGKMKPADKDAEMKRFAQGKTNIMVATTVIEVGVNVPNASVMIIENAERFGLSQLHQLRGRVGRGADQSYCILMTSHKLSADSKTRLETMCRTNDGFEIAEVDLKLRGPGDLMGTQQSGILNLQIADLVKDRDILQLARHRAIEILKRDAPMELPEHSVLRKTYIELTKKKNLWNHIS